MSGHLPQEPAQNASESAARGGVTRRSLLRTAGVGAAGLIAAPFVIGSSGVARAAPKTVKLAWSTTAVCHSPISVALHRGLFEKHNLKVENIKFGSTTNELLEAIATGHADGGIGMALRWFKPLEQGFDVLLTTGTHGGCMRLVAPRTSGIAKLEDLRGKAVGITDQASPVKNFFAIQLAKQGIDPYKEIEWRQFPGDLLGTAIDKGEVHAAATEDPHAYFLTKKEGLVEVSSNLLIDGRDRSCCVLGLRGDLVRNDPETARAITQAIREAAAWSAHNPDETAKIFAPHTANISPEDIAAMLKSESHQHHPVAPALKQEIVRYAEELKLIRVLKQSTDPVKFAEAISVEIPS